MRILVVDDDRLNLKFADGYLKAYFTDYTAILCQDPTQVLHVLETENIDILLLDIIMPQMSGIDVLRQLRSMDVYNDLQIIMLTSVDDHESFKTCFELGANDYILKPIEITEFKARITAAAKTRSTTRMLREMIGIMTTQNTELKTVNSLLQDTQFHLIQSGKMAAIGELAAGIGYDINVPIEQVYANLGILEKCFNEIKEGSRNPVDSQEIDELIRTSKNDIEKVSRTIQSLLHLSWVKPEDENSPCELSELIQQVLYVVANEAKDVVEITKEINPIPQIKCNSGQIGQVLLNIIINGIEAIRAQRREDIGHVHIVTYQEEAYVCMKISDDGPGIPEDHLDKIFNPFFTTKEAGRGTGLGLSISYDIIAKKHKGSIEAQSQVNQGTTFTIKLPIEK